MRAFVLCADDFAISEPVSSAILDLIDRGRLTATSCLVTSRFWAEHAVLLRSFANHIDVGLHLNLIADDMLLQSPGYRPALQPYPRHARLILRGIFRRIDKDQIIMEIERQLDCFMEHWGSQPDFVDGHLHVHQLPVVREALIDVYKRRLAGRDCYVRNVASTIPAGSGRLKAAVIAALGGRRLRERLEASGIPHNDMFGGIYAFDQNVNYRDMMRIWLRGIGRSSLLMCHPGLVDTTGSDPIGACRQREYEYLCSDAFVRDCDDACVKPDRFRKIASAVPAAPREGR